MAGRIVYVAPTPSSNRNAEMDEVALALGRDAVHLIFLHAENVGASAPHSFPEVCRFHCLDRPKEGEPRARVELIPLLEQLNPTVVVVSGYAQRAMRQTMSWCRRTGVPYSLRSDGSIWTDRHKGWLKYLVRRLRLTPRVRAAESCLIGGQTNRGFWMRYGMRPDQEVWWPQWIEYDHFAKARLVDAIERQALLDTHGITTYPNFLYIGRHVALKNVDRLCEGLLRCDSDAGLILVGSGPETARIEARYSAKLEGQLHIIGNVTHEDLPKWYAAGDAFVLASGARENWGMVVNEATTAGLPVICHEDVGSVGDLVIDGRNGVTLSTNSPEEWGDVMAAAAAQPDLLKAMGYESTVIADEWKAISNPAECAAALLE